MPPALKRFFVSVIFGCLLAQLTGCSSTRSVPVGPDFATVEPKVLHPPGFEIAGYFTTDGVRHPFNGTVTLESDVFVLHPTTPEKTEGSSEVVTQAPPETLRVPRSDVAAFDHYQSSHTLLIVGACVAIAVGFLAIGESLSGN
jgi:hypothetical protein